MLLLLVLHTFILWVVGKEVPRLLRQEMEKELAELIELNERRDILLL